MRRVTEGGERAAVPAKGRRVWQRGATSAEHSRSAEEVRVSQWVSESGAVGKSGGRGGPRSTKKWEGIMIKARSGRRRPQGGESGAADEKPAEREGEKGEGKCMEKGA